MAFVIDTKGSSGPKTPTNPSKSNIVTELLKDYKLSLKEKQKSTKKEQTKKSATDQFFEDMGWTSHPKKRKRLYDTPVVSDEVNREPEVKAALAKSVLTPDFEKLHTVPRYDVSEKKLKEERQKEREKTKGAKWYGLPATEMTEEVKRDLEVIQMRSVLDPKHFYKKNDLKVLPKYFHIGKVCDSPLDYYNNRLTKKERKKTLVDELMADAEFNKYNKRKYQEIVEEKQKTHYKAWRQAKKLKKKK